MFRTSTGRVYISRDVVFDEHVFPFSHLHPNAGARLRAKLSVLPDSLLNAHTSFGDPTLLDHCGTNSPPANRATSSGSAVIDTGILSDEEMNKSDKETGVDAHHFMCPLPGNNMGARLEPDPLHNGGAAPGSGSESAPALPSQSASPHSSTAGSSAPLPDNASPSSSSTAVQSDPGAGEHAPASATVEIPPPRSSAGGGSIASSAPPPIHQHQGPVTRLQRGIQKPKIFTDGTVGWGMSASTIAGEPTSVGDALKDQR